MIAKHQHGKNQHRQTNAHGQRLHRAVTGALITEEEEQSGKQAADHANQQKHDDELEHGRLP